ncbi:MAG TPA: hypothetical protein VK171_01515 [Fimbriimonas sp.]|nr:hypothetical protein [Fimbriimonas sp.]
MDAPEREFSKDVTIKITGQDQAVLVSTAEQEALAIIRGIQFNGVPDTSGADELFDPVRLDDTCE